MSRQEAADPLPHLAAVARALNATGQPGTAFAALDRALGAVLGHKLFTVLVHHAGSGESERFYTNQPEAYPVGGRKALNPTFWTDHVLKGQRAFIGHTAEDIAAVFFDHALIVSLGCASVINLPVVFDGRTLGTINLLHEAGWYEAQDAEIGAVFAAMATAACLRLSELF